MSLAPITGDGGKLAAQATDQTQKTTPVQEFQGILKNGLNTIKEDMDRIFSRIICHDLFYIILGFFIWWDASVFGHTARSSVIGCQCKAYVSSEPVQILF